MLDPGESPTFVEIWKSMEKVYLSPENEGKCRAIGVSNFGVKLLQEVMKEGTTVPACNQVGPMIRRAIIAYPG